MPRIYVFVSVALVIACAGCDVNISSENAFTATPDFVTATLPPSLISPATQTPPLPASTLSIVTEPTTTPIEGTTTTQINVRAETSTASETLGLIEQFAKVQVTGRDASGSWYRIVLAESKTGYGWIRAEYVQVNAPEEIPLVEVVAGNGPGVSGLVIQKINVRSGPGTNYDSLGVLSPNDVIVITGKDPSNEWMQIMFTNASDGLGWVASEFLQTGNTEALPVIEPATEMPVSAATPSTPEQLPAMQDDDSMQAPLTEASLSPKGARSLQVTNSISVSGGDAEDWVQFTSTSKAITIQVTCSNGALNVELWNNANVVKNAFLPCGDKQLLIIMPGNVYFLRFSESSANESHYIHYILSLEAIR